jgi:hypothetical protein
LDITPLHLLWRTGLGTENRSYVPIKHLLMLEARQLASFTAATGLSPAEADALTLQPFTDRYPPLTQALVRAGSADRPRSIFPAGLLATRSRYCPLCLAGDGSPIQSRYGGPWKRRWRLGISFACPEHNVFLGHLCPTCHRPALSGYPDSALFLLPASGKHGIHAVACRNSLSGSQARHVCKQRLDQVDPPDLQLSPLLAALQQRLLDRLEPTHPAEQASRWFADLHVASAVVRATWPAAISLVPSELQRALDEHIFRQQSVAQSPSTGPKRRRKIDESWTSPPEDTLAAAALLAAAEQLVTAPGAQEPEEPECLVELLRRAPGQRERDWGDTWTVLARASSLDLRQRMDQTYRAKLPYIWLRPGSEHPPGTDSYFEPIVAVKDRGFSVQHIPQMIPDDWSNVFARHAGMTRSPSIVLKRAIAVQLIQSATGHSFRDAAELLGVPSNWMTVEPKLVHPVRRHSGWTEHDFPRGIESLAEHIAENLPKTHYPNQRHRFAAWDFDDATWEALLRRTLAPRKSLVTNARSCASALVWSRLTGSEYRLAPVFALVNHRPTRLGSLWSWDAYRAGRPTAAGPSTPELFEGLEKLAEQLKMAPDAHA